MKKSTFLTIALSGSLAFSSLALPTISQAEVTKVSLKTTTMYTTQGVYARDAPSLNSNVVTTLPRNTAIKVLGTSQKSWYRVLLNKEIVYVYKEYVSAKLLPAIVKTGYVKQTNNLAVRTTASNKGTKIGTLKNGAAVQLTKNYTAASKDAFFQIIYNNQVAYVSSSKIDFSKAAPATPTTKVGVVRNTSSVVLKVREKPSTQSTIVGTLKNDATVKFAKAYKKGATDSWYKIKYKGKTAYVAAQYVSPLFPE